MVKQQAPYTVTCADGSEANGIANIMQALLAQNFANKPKLVKVARKMRHPFTVFNTDTETVCTVTFARDGIVIHNGITGEPNVALYVTSDQLLEMSRIRIRGGGLLPIGLLSRNGIKVVKQLITRKIVIKGLLSHTMASMRTLALVSLAD